MGALHWTKPFHGVTHGYLASSPSLGKPWVTVSAYESFAKLVRFNPGFSATESHHDDLEQAKAAGEAWMRNAEVAV